MTAVTVSFRWLDILEKEFDKAFVDLDIIVGEITDFEDGESFGKAQSRLQALASCFAQLTHKAQTIFQNNAKLEAELVNLRSELTETKVSLEVAQKQSAEIYQNALLKDPDVVLDNAKEEKNVLDKNELSLIGEHVTAKHLSRENAALRRLLLAMQGELCGARLAAKYLDKELAGRIQQLQLLGRELRWQQEHDKLWRQLESEINLHRHKTVVRACRSSIPVHKNGMQTEFVVGEKLDCSTVLNLEELPRPLAAQNARIVTINKQKNQSLGMSVTGGREHGVPIIVSFIHSGTPAAHCAQVFVGDAILAVDGQKIGQMSHSEAVMLLSQPAESVTLELLFVPPDEDDTASFADDPFAFKYRMFDDDVLSVTSSVPCVTGRSQTKNRNGFLNLRDDESGRLSRASLDSIRGSDVENYALCETQSNCGCDLDCAATTQSCENNSLKSVHAHDHHQMDRYDGNPYNAFSGDKFSCKTFVMSKSTSRSNDDRSVETNATPLLALSRVLTADSSDSLPSSPVVGMSVQTCSAVTVPQDLPTPVHGRNSNACSCPDPSTPAHRRNTPVNPRPGITTYGGERNLFVRNVRSTTELSPTLVSRSKSFEDRTDASECGKLLGEHGDAGRDGNSIDTLLTPLPRAFTEQQVIFSEAIEHVEKEVKEADGSGDLRDNALLFNGSF